MLECGNKWRSAILTNLVLIPSFMFLYLPIIILVIFSFNSLAFPAHWRSFTVNWYIELINTDGIWPSFANSLYIAAASTMLCVLFGLVMLYLESTGKKVSRYVPLFYSSLAIPEIVIAVGLLVYFTYMHIPLGMLTVIVAHSVIGLGFTIPMLFSRYQEISYSIYEASIALGASPLKTFINIIIPLTKQTIVSSSIIVFILSFDEFVLAYFCGGVGFKTLPIFLVSSIRNDGTPAVINALSTILIIITTSLAVVLFAHNKKPRVL